VKEELIGEDEGVNGWLVYEGSSWGKRVREKETCIFMEEKQEDYGPSISLHRHQRCLCLHLHRCHFTVGFFLGGKHPVSLKCFFTYFFLFFFNVSFSLLHVYEVSCFNCMWPNTIFWSCDHLSISPLRNYLWTVDFLKSH